jgi:hypothetical protein
MQAIEGPSDCFALRSFDPARDPAWFWRPVYTQLTEDMALRHATGAVEIGTYAMVPAASTMEFPTCRWIAADFDGKRQGCDWQSDVQRFLSFITESGANILTNTSRSGKGVHVRVLFKTPVPAWMARRWMNAWLEEASVVSEIDDAIPSSFDRIIPMQDTLRSDLTTDEHRRPGNLVGAPLHRRLAATNKGTLPISTKEAADGNFEPDGKHWDHLMEALDGRAWGEAELRNALADAPGINDLTPPPFGFNGARSLPVLSGSEASTSLGIARMHCAFFEYIQRGGAQPYGLWIALASHLHHFGADGHSAFHEWSALDSRYKPSAVDQVWKQTSEMRPWRCDTLVDHGFRCPHLTTKRCNGARSPAFIADHLGYNPL